MRRTETGPNSHLNARRRAAELETLAGGSTTVDVLVIGGGVTGAGVALDAASRGLSVALLERRSLANGTSRWSSKLAHGGLRYLASLQFGIAWESARERHRLMGAIAPHLIRALPQVTPSFGRHPQPTNGVVEVGIRIGDAMRAMVGTSHRRLPAMRRIGAEEARQWVPSITRQELRGGILHWDGQLEDDARLVIGLGRTAAAYGAQIITYAEVEQITAGGADAVDVLTGQRFQIAARHVINATGVWAGGLVDGLNLRPSKGSHVLVPASRLDNPRAALLVPIPGHFGRFVFAVPRPDGLVLIGLTDEPYDGPIPDAPQPTEAEEDFLLSTASTALSHTLTREDVVGRYAGLRPLIDNGEDATADVSREHAVLTDPLTGAVTVVGGKLTTYRQMAQDAVDAVVARDGLRAGRCRTARLPIVGAQPYATPAPLGVPERLHRRFGAEAGEIAALAIGRPELLEPVGPGVPVLGVELRAALEREGALNAADALDVHTRAGLIPEWREAVAEAIDRVAPQLHVFAA